MSDTSGLHGPGDERFARPQFGPPTGPPPGYASSGGAAPEYLEQGAGGPIPGGSAGGGRRSGRRGRRGLILGVGLVLVLAVVGGAAWAAMSFFRTGAQPAQALPATTLGYASIDLDPSGGQKIDALRTLKKFPALAGKIGLSSDADLRAELFDKIKDSSTCTDVDYAKDIKPWLGNRAAIAAVQMEDHSVETVGVLQVSDASKADAGLRKLMTCDTTDSPDGTTATGKDGGWVIKDGWAVIADTTAIAQQVEDETQHASLADDSDFKKWTAAAGDSGVMTLYASPAAGDYLADHADSLFGSGTALGGDLLSGSSSVQDAVPSAYTPGAARTADPSNPALAQLKNFKGAAVIVRFADGALEVESAGDTGMLTGSALTGSSAGGDVIATLPSDTAAAVGLGFAPHWFSGLLTQITSFSGGMLSPDDLVKQIQSSTGLTAPGDIETLTGKSAALVLGPGIDPATIDEADPASIPVALKVQGDPDAINAVLAKLEGKAPEAAKLLGTDTAGDMIAIGPDSALRADVVKNGGLGASDAYRSVITHASGDNAVLFVNVDQLQGAIDDLAKSQPEVAANLTPLKAIGISAWTDGGVAHSMLRITTN